MKKLMMAALVAGMGLMVTGCTPHASRADRVGEQESSCSKVGTYDSAGVYLCRIPTAGNCVIIQYGYYMAMSCPSHLNQPAD